MHVKEGETAREGQGQTGRVTQSEWERERERECARLRTQINASLCLLPQQVKVRANQNKWKADASGEKQTASNQPLREDDYCLRRAKGVTVKAGAVWTQAYVRIWVILESLHCTHLLDNKTSCGYWNLQKNTCNMPGRFGSQDVTEGRCLCMYKIKVYCLYCGLYLISAQCKIATD